MVFFN